MATRAFDVHHPPDQELIDDCVHCGFCLPTCPTYVLWGEEMDSPRGRIVLMNKGLEEGSELTDQIVTHIDRCLGCMACVTACPSGVQYDKLIEATRPQIERNHARSPADRLFRALVFAAFTHPGFLRASVPLLTAYRKSGLAGRVQKSGLLARFPRLGMLERLTPSVTMKAVVERVSERTPAKGERRAVVGLLRGCVQRVFFNDVNAATVRVLAAEGFEVRAPQAPGCCGALQLHAGEERGALERARRTIAAFEECEYVAINAAGCGSAMKDYAHLLRDDPEWAERAAEFSAKVRDVAELMSEHDPVAPRGPVELEVAYHDACHLAHAQGVRAEPRKLLSAIPGLKLVEPDGWEVCCGSAGVYNLLQPEAAAELGRRKAENLLATGAEAIAAANPGCTLQIAATLADMGEARPILHPIELLDRSITNGNNHGRGTDEH